MTSGGVPASVPQRVAATLFSRNFLAQARVLGTSLATFHPDVPLFGLLIDDPLDGPAERDEPFGLVGLEELPLAPFEISQLAFRYQLRTLASAAKPLLLRLLLDRGHREVLLVDSDMLVVGSLDGIFDALASSSIVLSPHRLGPAPGDDRIGVDLRLLQVGTFNGGLIAVRAGDSADGFLSWWWQRVRYACEGEIERGLHFDQRWLDLAPGLFPDVRVVRDPRFNVAYWNFDERQPLLAPGPEMGCRLVHFSGYDPEHPEAVSRYAPGARVSATGGFSQLFERYHRLLMEHGASEAADCGLGSFDNEVPIPDLVRTIFRDFGPSAARFGDPFATAPAGSFYRWLQAPAPGEEDRSTPITNLWMEVYRRREDVRQVFPDPTGSDRSGFIEWTSASGLGEHDLPEAFRIPR